MNPNFSSPADHIRSRTAFYSTVKVNQRLNKDLKEASMRLIKKEVSRHKIVIEPHFVDKVKSPHYFISKARSQYLNSKGSLSSTLSKISANSSFSQSKSTLRRLKCSSSTSAIKSALYYSNTESLPGWLVSRQDFKEVVYNLNQNQISIPTIFQEHVNSRTSEQKNSLIEYVKSLKFFSKIPIKVIQNVCDKLKREDYEPGANIIRKGERGDCIYIIYSGTANIYLEANVLHCKVYEREVIGEQALDNAKPRNATVVAESHMVTFKLDKFDYDTILLNIKKQEKSENLQFLEKIEFFSKWSHLKIQNFVFHILQKNYTDGQVIFDRGDPGDTFYVIKSGEVEIQAYVNLIENNCWPVGWKEWKVTEIKRECIATIIKLKAGDFFGEQSLLRESNRISRAVSIGNSLLLTINRDEFSNIFGKKDFEELKEISKYEIPNSEELRKKLQTELDFKRSNVRYKQHQALISSFNIDYKYAESRDSLLDNKTKKLISWIQNVKKRKKLEAENFKKRVVSEDKKRLKIKSVKDLHQYFQSVN